MLQNGPFKGHPHPPRRIRLLLMMLIKGNMGLVGWVGISGIGEGCLVILMHLFMKYGQITLKFVGLGVFLFEKFSNFCKLLTFKL
jgi:hypothetical protein